MKISKLNLTFLICSLLSLSLFLIRPAIATNNIFSTKAVKSIEGLVNSDGDIYFRSGDDQKAYIDGNTAIVFQIDGVTKMSLDTSELTMDVNIDMNGYSIAVSSVTYDNDGLKIKDTDESHLYTIRPYSDLSSDRTLFITTGDSDRTITLSGNPTLSDWFDQSVKQAASPTFAGITLNNTGLHILDTNASHDLILAPGSDLSVDRTLTFTTGDSDRTITLNGNPTLNDWFDQSLKENDSPSFNGLTVTGDIDLDGNGIKRLAGTQEGPIFYLSEDVGAAILVDMSVSTGQPSSTEESYEFRVDNIPFLKIYAEADGSGGLQNENVYIYKPLTTSDTVTLINTGLHILDTNASHDLVIAPGSDLSADRTLTFTTGDSDRTITLSGNPTLNDWFDQSVKQAASPTFAGVTLNGNLDMNGNNIVNLGGSSIKFQDDIGAATLIDFVVSASPAGGTEESYAFKVDGTTFAKVYAEADGTGGIQNMQWIMEQEELMEKQGTASAGTQYDSYATKFRASVWDQSGAGQAEDRVASMLLEADSGLDGSEPYKLVIKDNSDNRCFTFNFTEDKHGIVVGSDWTGTWSGLPFLAYKDYNGGYVIRVHNVSTGASAYAGMQIQNDLNRNLEVAIGGGSRGDAWADVAWIWGSSNVNKTVFGTNGTMRMAINNTGLRVQPDITINDGAITPLDVRTSSAVTPPALSAYSVATFSGPDNAAITIVSANNQTDYIFFADTDAQGAGWIAFNHTTNYLEQSVGGTARTRLLSGGLSVSPTANYNAAAPLDVRSSGYVTTPSILGATVGVFTGPSNANVSIIAGNANYSNLYMGDTDSETVAGFEYNHSTNEMAHRVGAGTGMTLSTTALTMDVNIALNGNIIDLGTDPGAATLVDMTVTAAAGAGTEESIGMDIDGTNLFKVYSESDGAGGLQNTAIHAKARFKHMENGTIDIQTYNQDLADDAYFDLPAGVDGFIMASWNDGQTVHFGHFNSDATLEGIYQYGDADWSDSDGKFCIFDNGTHVRVRNRYGATYPTRVWTWFGI